MGRSTEDPDQSVEKKGRLVRKINAGGPFLTPNAVSLAYDITVMIKAFIDIQTTVLKTIIDIKVTYGMYIYHDIGILVLAQSWTS
jgi:hypothetical protein